MNNKNDIDSIDIASKSKLKMKFGKSYTKKFDNLKVKYKFDKKKYIVLGFAIFMMIAALFSSSYAYLTYVSKTDSTTTIETGNITLSLEEEDNQFNLVNAYPMSLKKGLETSQEYNFTITNTGTIETLYKVVLNSLCEVGEVYKISNKEIKADKCILDSYIKIAVKANNDNDYKIVDKTDDKYIIATGNIGVKDKASYSIKMWLSEDTPNMFNGKNGNSIFIGSLGVEYEQIS